VLKCIFLAPGHRIRSSKYAGIRTSTAQDKAPHQADA